MPKSRTRKKAHQKLERLNQSWLNSRHDKTIVAREIQLLILWKQNLWNYHRWKNITDFIEKGEHEITNSDTRRLTGFGTPQIQIALDNFRIPDHVLTRHRGIMGSAGIKSNGRLKRMFDHRGREWKFQQHLKVMFRHFGLRKKKLMKEMHFLALTEKSVYRQFRKVCVEEL